ncbi:hypothetical protein SAMN02746068_01962 [Lactococcus chungangensis CAU 28 = DSM 22330]|uniref:Uncharacterized protein n=1 Tax=Pseudolactococcus chungangensis CAU 28 = DSM 22330 TaxID=1122154 RepID=A0A1K2HIE3_9LACT|nr:hypothetical protein SAMN02746068_01962 [Lactococcus chungangensis CAU 28 = DSM 22330]
MTTKYKFKRIKKVCIVNVLSLEPIAIFHKVDRIAFINRHKKISKYKISRGGQNDRSI